MAISIIKTFDALTIGSCVINESHQYRGILNYVFIKILEYYGLDGLKYISIMIPEDYEFGTFLEELGFIQKGDNLEIILTKENLDKMINILLNKEFTIQSRQGQLEAILKFNNETADEKEIKRLTRKIIGKIQNYNRLQRDVWGNRTIVKLKNSINTAILLKNKDRYKSYLSIDKIFDNSVIEDEYPEFFLKTLISSFDTGVRGAYLEEIFKTIDGKAIITIPYIQEIVDKFVKAFSEEVKQINRDELRQWIVKNSPQWEMKEKIRQQRFDSLLKQSRLRSQDFGTEIKSELQIMINSIVDHYNGEKIFYGLSEKI